MDCCDRRPYPKRNEGNEVNLNFIDGAEPQSALHAAAITERSLEEVTQVIFLDFDGVLNSTRSIVAYGGCGMSGDVDSWYKMDEVAIRLVKGMSRVAKAPIVVSSVWRHGGQDKLEALKKYFGFNIVSATGHELGIRGNQIKLWLERNPHITNYVILDDESDMLPEQQKHFVHVNGMEGLSFQNITDACKVLGISPYGINHPRNKNGEESLIIH